MASSWAASDNQYPTVYGGGVFEVGIHGTAGFSNEFTSSSAILSYLPTSGVSLPLTQDNTDPIVDYSGTFGGDVTALQLDLDFDAHNLMPGSVHFADVTICNETTLPALNGLSVPAFVAILNTLLGGGTGPYTIAQLEGVTGQLANAFPNGVVSPFAQDHLVVGACDATPTPTPTSTATPTETPTPGPLGQSCSSGSECLSMFCVGGVCCDRACTSPLESCTVSGRAGTCTVGAAAPVASARGVVALGAVLAALAALTLTGKTHAPLHKEEDRS